MLALLLAAFTTVAATNSDVRGVPLFSISYPPPQFAVSNHGDVLLTEQFAFFGTDGGLYRAALPLRHGAAPQHIAFASTPVTGLARRDGTLYAILDINHPTGPGATSRSLLKSEDDGLSWTPMDHQLEECLAGICTFLPASQIAMAADRIFVNAGGNVLVSADEGHSWSILFGVSSTGRPQSQSCYDPSFVLVGDRLLLGGECPLDTAYLRTGTLRPDLLDWSVAPEPALTPFLENRNVQFIQQRGTSNVVYAGIEGALLRSDDAGASYRFVLHYDGVGPKYPYITHILFPSQDPSAIVIAGFDKGAGGPFLSVSWDDGATWTDVSYSLPGVGSPFWSVSMLKETPEGQWLVGAEDDENGALHVYELRTDRRPARRRAVRR